MRSARRVDHVLHHVSYVDPLIILDCLGAYWKGHRVDGSGGGQPFYATAGGKRAWGIDTAVKKIIESITA